MDPKKVRIITEWQAPNYIKDVQAFLNFANFYQKFCNECNNKKSMFNYEL